MKLISNLKDLIKDAHYWQYADIGDTKDKIKKKKPMFYFLKIQWFFIIIAVIYVYFISVGFNDYFAGYIITALSLLIGLSFNFILTLFNKFSNIDFEKYKEEISIEKNVEGKKLKNFFRKTSILTQYSALLGILCIILLSMTLILPEANANIELKYLLENIRNICFIEIGIVLHSCLIIYFLLDFLLITVYVITAFYDYFISEINKVKL